MMYGFQEPINQTLFLRNKTTEMIYCKDKSFCNKF